MKSKDLKNILMTKHHNNKLSSQDFLSTGSTLLNLACTGKPLCGFAKGHYYFLVGDTTSGKTFLSLTCLAEASINSNFDKYRFIYDNSENGALMDIERFFGKKVLDRMEPPDSNEDIPAFSSTIEEFYYHVDDAIRAKTPFIYILDSMDALSSSDETDKFKETKKAYLKGRETTGSFGDGKAKKNSANLRRLIPELRKTGSILIIINQTRDNLGYGFNKKSRSGGHALSFYACLEMWSSVIKKINKDIDGKKRQLGINCQVQIKKNRITGRERTINIPIYHSFGIDDIGSCVDYLIEEGHWNKIANKIKATEFDFEGKTEKLIRHIEKEGLEKDLKMLVGDVWDKIEEQCKVNRKSRYE